MKKLLALLGLAVALFAAGFFFGYDFGYERGVRSTIETLQR
ncbi:MAG TPA: hypothetical protein VD862_00215 [Candidatus Paceibacterota bacterium]|nr:hypothetical protein [Candidatus Paceibacterota bacterium]